MGSSLDLKGSGVMANGYRTIELWEDGVKISEISMTPTKLSAFLNDLGYITSSAVSNVGKTGKFSDLSDVPDFVKKVDVKSEYDEGTKIATVEVDGKSADIYMPDLEDVSISYRLVGDDGDPKLGYRRISLEWSADGKEWITVSTIQTPRTLSGLIDDIGAGTAADAFDKEGKLDSDALSVSDVAISVGEGGKAFGPFKLIKGVPGCFYAQPDNQHVFKYWVVGEDVFEDNPVNITADSDSVKIKAVFEKKDAYRYVFLTDWTQLIDKLPSKEQDVWYPLHYRPMSEAGGEDVPLCEVLEDEKLKKDISSAKQYIAGLLDKNVGFNYKGTVVSTSITSNKAFVEDLDNVINSSSKISRDEHLVYLFILDDASGYKLAAYKYYSPVSGDDEDMFEMKNGDQTDSFIKVTEFDIDSSRLPYFIALDTTGHPFRLEQLRAIL